MAASDVKLLHSARAMIEHEGEDALTLCARRADAMIERGDLEGYDTWVAILALVKAARSRFASSSPYLPDDRPRGGAI